MKFDSRTVHSTGRGSAAPTAPKCPSLRRRC